MGGRKRSNLGGDAIRNINLRMAGSGNYLVIPRQPTGELSWAKAEAVQASSSDEAAAHAYNRCVVIACDVFPQPEPEPDEAEPWEQPSHVEGDDHDDLSSPARPA